MSNFARIGTILHVLATLALGVNAALPLSGCVHIKPAPEPKPTVAIVLDEQFETKVGYITRISAHTTGKSVKWRVISGPDAQPSLNVVDSHTVDFASPKPGKFILQASTSVNGEAESADTEILNGDAPPGPPAPDPPAPDPPAPDPPPAPPQPPAPSVGLLKVLIVKDSDPVKRGKYTPGQMAAMDSVKVLGYLNAHCAKGPDGKTPEHRVWPDNADASRESASWQAAFGRSRKSLPWVVISNGTPNGYEGPLPGNVDEMLRLLQQYGGP